MIVTSVIIPPCVTSDTSAPATGDVAGATVIVMTIILVVEKILKSHGACILHSKVHSFV